MDEITLSSWDKFEDLSLTFLSKRIETGAVSYDDQVLFRGHSHKKWSLQTTFDRIGKIDYPCKTYDNNMRAVSRAVKTVTGSHWEFSDYKSKNPFDIPDNTEFMTYLRQNGLPSPLLDWTQSPYVASYFAFLKADIEESDHVAIFTYTDTTDGSRGGGYSDPTIFCLGPWIPSDKKHFVQQSRYTICRREAGSSMLYASHQKAFDRNDPTQSVVRKYLIPTSQKESVLRKLRVMNITEYSLFETVQGLLSVLAGEVFSL